MDSLSQMALGSAVGIAVMGRRTPVWRAALVGAICGTLPDLDALIDHGDPIRNMTLHRTESHALFYLTLAAPFLAWGVARLARQAELWRRWWLAIWLALITHPLLDLMTVYGTQLGLPFTDTPFAIGSVFIIDPLYTLPLLVGLVFALAWRDKRALRTNAVGLALSTVYLAWSVAAQTQIRHEAEAALHAQGEQITRLLVTPTAFNTVLWRIVAITPQGEYLEAYRSLFDDARPLRFERRPQGLALREALRGNPAMERSIWFSRGFFRLRETAGEVRISDLRMGQEPYYTFNFTLAQRQSDGLLPVTPVLHMARPDLRTGLAWLTRRIGGEELPPPN